MSLSFDDTIAAIASAPGGATRGIVRITGPGALAAVERCFRSHNRRPSDLRQATMLRGMIELPAINSRLDADLLFWPNHRSYTGQPSAELHTIGSPPLLQAVLDAVCGAGCRPAAPGEFTLRAVLTGRMDFTQAEAVLGVINARGDRELRVALDQLAGGFGAPLRSLRGELLDTLADLEAGLDFVEEDIEFIDRKELARQLSAALDTVRGLQRRLDVRSTNIELPRVVLVGFPNAGKSSLFNALAGKEQALVSHVAGTTRDYLTVRLKLDGVECELIDTAGLEDDAVCDTIDGAAQQLARQQHEQADVQIMCIEAAQGNTAKCASEVTVTGVPYRINVLTKCDLVSTVGATDDVVVTSVKTGMGMAELRSAIRAAVVDLRRGDAPVVATTAARCRDSLRGAAESLAEAGRLAEGDEGDEVIAAELRLALDALGEVVGAVFTDDILDRIFSRFCIGK